MKYHAFISSLASALLLLGSCLTFTSCDYKDLCYDHHHLVSFRVLFDWSNVPDAQPEGMTVLFYNLDAPGTNPTRFDLPGREGGVVKLEPGNYRAVAYNYDTETILLSNIEEWNSLTAYTRGSSIEEGTMLSRGPIPRAAGTDSEPVILEPDMLYACAGEPFKLEFTDNYTTYDDNIEGAGGIASQKLYTITLKPNQRVRRVNLYVNNVQNLAYGSQFGGALSTLSWPMVRWAIPLFRRPIPSSRRVMLSLRPISISLVTAPCCQRVLPTLILSPSMPSWPMVPNGTIPSM